MSLEKVYVMYTGSRVGGFTVTGKVTRNQYRVNKDSPLIVVAAADAPDIVTRPDFRLASTPQASPALSTAKQGNAALEVAQQVASMFPKLNASAPVQNTATPSRRMQRPVDPRGTRIPKL
jgi:hypothetical protein